MQEEKIIEITVKSEDSTTLFKTHINVPVDVDFKVETNLDIDIDNKSYKSKVTFEKGIIVAVVSRDAARIIQNYIVDKNTMFLDNKG